MRTVRRKIFQVTVPALLTTAVLAGQQAPRTGQQTPTFRSTTDLITTDVVVRDKDGKFIPDLRLDEFQVFEDGVPQKIVGFVRNIGGRVLTDLSPTMTAPVTEGLVLPPTKQDTSSSGRIFIIFIDDLHLQALDSPQVRRVLGMIRDTVIHENDLVGLVSSGYSSIQVDVAYDHQHKRFNESIKKVMGSGMTPTEIIQANQTAQGPAGLRHNTHVAFSTAYDMLSQAEKITNRRKAFIYVSNGYDFNPFKDSRYKYEQEKYAMPLQDQNSGGDSTGGSSTAGPDPAGENPFEKNGQQFAETDLISELAELVRAARRANTSFYTIDPRGLDAGPSIAYNLSMEEWRRFVDTSVSSLRVLGDETGGFCICMTNNFEKGLQEIDNAMSDYYLLGYVSSNPDPLRVRRRIEIKVTRAGAQTPKYTAEYSLKRPSRKGK